MEADCFAVVLMEVEAEAVGVHSEYYELEVGVGRVRVDLEGVEDRAKVQREVLAEVEGLVALEKGWGGQAVSEVRVYW